VSGTIDLREFCSVLVLHHGSCHQTQGVWHAYAMRWSRTHYSVLVVFLSSKSLKSVLPEECY
jgi:hypothetical protein